MNGIRFLGIGIATRAQRRCLVVLMYVSFLATGAAFSWNRFVAFPPALLCCLAFLGLYKLTRPYAIPTSRRDPILPDEREASVRDFAMARSYLVVSFLFLLLVGLMQQHVHITDPEWNYLLWGVMLLTSALPQSVIAWLEPDAPEPDAPCERGE